MRASGAGLLLVGLVVASLIDVNNACSCLIYSLEHSICTGDYAMKVKIGSQTTVGSDVIFKVKKILWMYHMDHCGGVDMTKIWSDITSCGVSFTAGKNYLVTGSISDGKLKAHGCHYTSLWSSLTTTQKNKLARGSYCDCPSSPIIDTIDDIKANNRK